LKARCNIFLSWQRISIAWNYCVQRSYINDWSVFGGNKNSQTVRRVLRGNIGHSSVFPVLVEHHIDYLSRFLSQRIRRGLFQLSLDFRWNRNSYIVLFWFADDAWNTVETYTHMANQGLEPGSLIFRQVWVDVDLCRSLGRLVANYDAGGDGIFILWYVFPCGYCEPLRGFGR